MSVTSTVAQSAEDYAQLVEVRPPHAIREGATATERLSLAALHAHRWKRAYLEAYAASYKRYQDARAAKDAGAMARQARAMIDFALSAQEGSREAALKWHQLLRLVDEAVKAGEEAISKQGKSWSETFEDWQGQLKTSGLPSDLREAMVAAGIPDQEVEALRRRLLALTSKEAAEGLAAYRASSKTEAAIPPEPADIASLERREYIARALYRSVTQTRIELSRKKWKEEVEDAGATKDDQTYWWAVPTGETPRLYEETLIRSAASGPLVSGEYDVYVLQGKLDPVTPIPGALCIAHGIQVEEGKTATALLETGLRLEPAAEGCPEPHSWFVLASGDASTAIVAQRTGKSFEPLWLPPGRYDVYWIQSAEHVKRPLLIARGVEVKENQLAVVPVQHGGIRLLLAAWAPPVDKSHGWWGAVQTGDAAQHTVHRTASDDKLLLLPGHYDVYWAQDYYHKEEPLLLAKCVQVSANEVVTIGAESGIQLEVANWVPARDKAYGWWGVVQAGDTPQNRLHWSASDDKLLLMPGRYDVYWVQDFYHKDRPLLLAEDVDVKASELATISVASGIRLEVADWVPTRDKDHGWWGVVQAGDTAEERLHWSASDDKLLLVPGRYDVYWVQDFYHKAVPVLLAAAVEVKANELATISVSSGIKLKLPSNTAKLDSDHGWWGVVPAGAKPGERVAWSIGRFDQPLLVPPGTYDVVWKQNFHHVPETIKKGVSLSDSAKSAPLEVEVHFGKVLPE